MAVTVELYRKKETEEIKEEIDYAKAMNCERVEICQKSGLQAQAKLSQRNWINIEEMYHRLSFYESEIWSQFLPTTYSKNAGHWRDYLYDQIPMDALEEIRFAESLQIFDDLEIWTPENKFKDPVAVGVVYSEIAGGRLKTYSLIVRWAEGLKPFDEIEEEVLNDNLRLHGNVSFSSITEIVRNYIRNIQKRMPRFIVHIYGQAWNPFHWHCWRRMWVVDHSDVRVFVCGGCGFTEKERRI